MSLLSVLAADENNTVFEAPNTWLPEAAEILWGTIAFVIIVGLLWKYAAKPIGNSLRGRTERIQQDIEGAAAARAEAVAEVEQIRQNLADVDGERARILAEAAETAARLRVEGLDRNDLEVQGLEARAESDISLMGGRATSELQEQVATWSADATERIVLAELDDTTLEQLLEQTIAKIGAASS
jgi:F-type H+-transporting ATPase subunit b